LVAIIVTDHEYPVRPAFSLLTKVLEDFTAKVPQSTFANPSTISFPEINTFIQKYQDPRQADAIMRVQQELDETKIILVRQHSYLPIPNQRVDIHALYPA
jgi:synaptobrevin homolog YKT6